MMFPPVVLSLFCLVLFLLCLPLGKLPLSFLTLEKRLYLREQDTGQSLYLMVGYPGSIVVGFLLAWHGITPLEPFLVKQIALEYCSISRYETAPCVFWYVLGGAGVVQDDTGQYAFGPAAYPEIHVVLDLAGENVSVWPLGGKYQVNTKGPPQACKGGKPVFDLIELVSVLLAPACPVQQFRHLVCLRCSLVNALSTPPAHYQPVLGPRVRLLHKKC